MMGDHHDRGGTYRVIPRFFKPVPRESDVLQQKLREEARALFLQRRSKLLLDNSELKELWALLDKHTTSPGEGMMDFDHFKKVLLI